MSYIFIIQKLHFFGDAISCHSLKVMKAWRKVNIMKLELLQSVCILFTIIIIDYIVFEIIPMPKIIVILIYPQKNM